MFSLVLLFEYLRRIGYIPLLKLISQPEGFEFANERIRINSIVLINSIVRNILVLQLIPLLSYITFSFMLVTKKFKWVILTVILFIASIITNTFNFEKAPIVIHLAVYLIILIYKFGGIKKRYVFGFGIVGVLLLVAAYSLLGANIPLGIYDGIIGRTVMTPAGMLALHFDLFPKVFDFLGGRSAPRMLLSLFGLGGVSRLRSSRLLMEFFGSEAVYSGTAGVMSTFFLGESYANFGIPGIVFSIIWVALVIAAVFAFFLKFRKTPVTIAIFAYFSIYIPLTTQGGFFDFVYNANWIFIVLIMVFLEFFPDLFEMFRNRVLKNS